MIFLFYISVIFSTLPINSLSKWASGSRAHGSFPVFGMRERGWRAIPTTVISQQETSAFLCLFDFFHWRQNSYVNQLVQIIGLLNLSSIYYSNLLSFCLHFQVLTRNKKITTKQHVTYSIWSVFCFLVNVNL